MDIMTWTGKIGMQTYVHNESRFCNMNGVVEFFLGIRMLMKELFYRRALASWVRDA